MPQCIFSDLEVKHNKIHLLKLLTVCDWLWLSQLRSKLKMLRDVVHGPGEPGGGAEARTEVPADPIERQWVLKY